MHTVLVLWDQGPTTRLWALEKPSDVNGITTTILLTSHPFIFSVRFNIAMYNEGSLRDRELTS
jgi:hypothetical protein